MSVLLLPRKVTAVPSRDLSCHVTFSEHTLCCQAHFGLALPLAAKLDAPGIVVHTDL